MEKLWKRVSVSLAMVFIFVKHGACERCRVEFVDNNNSTHIKETWCDNGCCLVKSDLYKCCVDMVVTMTPSMIFSVVAVVGGVTVVVIFVYLRTNGFKGFCQQNSEASRLTNVHGSKSQNNCADPPPAYWDCVPSYEPPPRYATVADIYTVDEGLPPPYSPKGNKYLPA